jgi:hypothetical protein
MRPTFFILLSLILSFTAARAQSVMDNLPPVIIDGESPAEMQEAKTPPVIVEPYTVTNVDADVTADTAAHARDKALMQAQRAAYKQLCARFNAADDSGRLSDDDIAALVQSFEVQRERVSAVRYIGVYTIRFNPAAVQRTISTSYMLPPEIEAPPQAAVSHISVAVHADSLMVWTQLKRRLSSVPQVSKIDTVNLSRGFVHIDLSYVGLLEDLKRTATEQGLILRQNEKGTFELYDGSMVSR